MTIADLGSSNGTFVNGTRLLAEAELADGDRLTLGETELHLAIAPPPIPPTAPQPIPTDGGSRPAPAPAEPAAPRGDTGPRAAAPSPAAEPPAAPSPPAVVPAAPPPRPEPGPRAAPAPAAAPVSAPTVAAYEPPTPPPPPAPPRSASATGGELLPSIRDIDLAPPVPAGRDSLPVPAAAPAPAPAPAAPAPAPAASAAAAPAPSAAARPEFLPPAGFWLRFVAWLVDGLWTAAVAVGASYLAGGPQAVAGGLILSGVAGLLAVAVPLVGWSRFGTTPGKRLLRLYVCPVEGGVGIGFGKALLRWVGYLVSACLFGLGFLMIGFSAAKRGLHDLIAGTYVGRKP